MKKSFILYEKFIGSFYNNVYSFNGNLSFHLDHVKILSSMDGVNTRCDHFQYNKNIKLGKEQTTRPASRMEGRQSAAITWPRRWRHWRRPSPGPR